LTIASLVSSAVFVKVPRLVRSLKTLANLAAASSAAQTPPVAEVKTPTYSSHSSNVGFGKWVTGSRGSQAQDMEKNLLFALSNQVLQQNSRY
jgi:hypothetical protein